MWPLLPSNCKSSVSKVLRYVVYLYRSSADAAKAFPAHVLRTGKTDLTGARFGFLRRGNVVVSYVADTEHLRTAFRGYLSSALDKVRSLKAALASL